jgi:hypothetical protein
VAQRHGIDLTRIKPPAPRDRIIPALHADTRMAAPRILIVQAPPAPALPATAKRGERAR